MICPSLPDNRPKGKKRRVKEKARKKRAGNRTGGESTRSQTGEVKLRDGEKAGGRGHCGDFGVAFF